MKYRIRPAETSHATRPRMQPVPILCKEKLVHCLLGGRNLERYALAYVIDGLNAVLIDFESKANAAMLVSVVTPQYGGYASVC